MTHETAGPKPSTSDSAPSTSAPALPRFDGTKAGTAENRRKAYAIVADLISTEIEESDSYRDTVGVRFPDEVRTELIRMYHAIAAAALVEDGPGVGEHTR